jgi:hypothetical protein
MMDIRTIARSMGGDVVIRTCANLPDPDCAASLAAEPAVLA